MSATEENNAGRKLVSVYQQITGILNGYKTNEVSLNDAVKKLQLKEKQRVRPYCKVTKSGAIALYGITKDPIVLYVEQWEKINKLIKADYLDNYIKYNETRVRRKKGRNDTTKSVESVESVETSEGNSLESLTDTQP